MPGPLWSCPRCGRSFANANQTHTCAPLGDLDRHFARSDPAVRATFDHVLGLLGPVEVLPEKTRIALHVRMSFAAFVPRRHWLDGHLVLPTTEDHPTFRRIQVFSPRNVLHAFRLTGPQDVDEAFSRLLRQAYRVGEQRHRSP
jgi:hypothetical protein